MSDLPQNLSAAEFHAQTRPTGEASPLLEAARRLQGDDAVRTVTDPDRASYFDDWDPWG